MLPALILLASIILFRAAPWLAGAEAVRTWANFSPLIALAVCGGAFLPRAWKVLLPASAVVLSHIAVSIASGWSWQHPFLLVIAGSLALSGLLGWKLNSTRLPALLAASGSGSVLFYVVSNTASFFMFPGYAPTFEGWMQALTLGLPGNPPTWIFGLRQLGGDLAFTVLFAWAMKAAVVKSAAVAVKADSVSSATPQSPVAG